MLYSLVKSEELIWQPCMILADVGVKSNARTPESTVLTKLPDLSGNHPKLI
jgi:hypothetical protein